MDPSISNHVQILQTPVQQGQVAKASVQSVESMTDVSMTDELTFASSIAMIDSTRVLFVPLKAEDFTTEYIS